MTLGGVCQLARFGQVVDIHTVVGGWVAGVAGVIAIGGGVACYLHMEQGCSGTVHAHDNADPNAPDACLTRPWQVRLKMVVQEHAVVSERLGSLWSMVVRMAAFAGELAGSCRLSVVRAAGRTWPIGTVSSLCNAEGTTHNYI